MEKLSTSHLKTAELSDFGQKLGEAIEKSAEPATNKVAQLITPENLKSIKDSAVNFKDSVVKMARKRPVVAAAGALAVGFVAVRVIQSLMQKESE